MRVLGVRVRVRLGLGKGKVRIRLERPRTSGASTSRLGGLMARELTRGPPATPGCGAWRGTGTVGGVALGRPLG